MWTNPFDVIDSLTGSAEEDINNAEGEEVDACDYEEAPDYAPDLPDEDADGGGEVYNNIMPHIDGHVNTGSYNV